MNLALGLGLRVGVRVRVKRWVGGPDQHHGHRVQWGSKWDMGLGLGLGLGLCLGLGLGPLPLELDGADVGRRVDRQLLLGTHQLVATATAPPGGVWGVRGSRLEAGVWFGSGCEVTTMPYWRDTR